jgi:hypothetical protein
MDLQIKCSPDNYPYIEDKELPKFHQIYTF